MQIELPKPKTQRKVTSNLQLRHALLKVRLGLLLKENLRIKMIKILCFFMKI